MSTNGSFTPAQVPECAYAPEMTRAEALAHRAAGTLNPNCVVVITDGPTIGTPGNTSPTIIELNPVTPTDLGMVARVHTTFHPDAAWAGIYDIDLGAQGSIQRLVDHWNNVGIDSDLDAPTVHTQVPWHKAGATFRDNIFDDCVLPGWDAAGGDIRDNTLQETTVDLTGKTAGTFSRNLIVGNSFTAQTATSFIAGNQIVDAVVSHVGTGAGSFSFQNNVMLTGTLEVDAATTAQVTFNNNVVGGSAGGFRTLVEAKTGGQAIITGNRLFNIGGTSYDLRMTNTGPHVFSSNEVGGGTIDLNSSGDTQIHANTFTDSLVNYTTGTLVQIRRSVIIGSTLNLSGTSTVDGGRLMKTTVTTGGFNLNTFDILGGTHTLTANNVNTASGPGFNNLI